MSETEEVERLIENEFTFWSSQTKFIFVLENCNPTNHNKIQIN